MIELVDHCKAKGAPLIVGVDSNSHSCLWGSETNRRGEDMELWIAEKGLAVENVGCAPTFVARGTATSVDITLLEDWRVSNEESFSDHKTIRFSIKQGKKPCGKLIPNLRKGDWYKFGDMTELEAPFPEEVTEDWLDGETIAITGMLPVDARGALHP